MWTKEIYRKALKQYRNLEEEINQAKNLSFGELYEKYKGWSLDGDSETSYFDMAYGLLTVTIEENEDDSINISSEIELWGDEEISQCEDLTLEELIKKAE